MSSQQVTAVRRPLLLCAVPRAKFEAGATRVDADVRLAVERSLHVQGRQLTLRSAVVFHGERSRQAHNTALELRGTSGVFYAAHGRHPVADGWHGVRGQIATRGVLLCYAD